MRVAPVLLRHLAIALVLLFQTTGLAQQGPDIQFGPTRLRLQMTEEAVIAMLADSYLLRKETRGNATIWLVWTRQSPSVLIGQLSFSAGRLNWASRDWGPTDQQKGFDFASTLYGAVNELLREARGNCRVGAWSRDSPGGDARTIYIDCGATVVWVDIIRNGDTNSAFVSETLGGSRLK